MQGVHGIGTLVLLDCCNEAKGRGLVHQDEVCRGQHMWKPFPPSSTLFALVSGICSNTCILCIVPHCTIKGPHNICSMIVPDLLLSDTTSIQFNV